MITLERISKTYETPAGSFNALRNIDLEITNGEFAAIVGKSGSGKSTLLNMIGGIDRPSHRIRLPVFPAAADAHRRGERHVADGFRRRVAAKRPPKARRTTPETRR